MAFPHLLYTIVSICLPILLFFGLSIFVKKKFNSYYGIFFGLIFSGFSFGALQAGAATVYVIDKDLTYGAYRVFGDYEVKFEKDPTTSILIPQGKTLIINHSNTPIVIDEIIYGTNGYYANKPEWKSIINNLDSTYSSPNTNENSYFIKPDSYEILAIKKNTINFFFEDDIPDHIEEYGVHGNIVKYWLHDIKNSNN